MYDFSNRIVKAKVVRSYTMLARLRVLSGSSGYTGCEGSLDDAQPRVLLRARPSLVAGDF